MELPEWLVERRGTFEKENPTLSYGLTIRLDTRGLVLRAPEHSEQVITVEHEGCRVGDLFAHLDEPVVKEHLLTVPAAQENGFTRFTQASFDIGLLVHVPAGSNARVDLTRTLSSERFVEHVLIVCEAGASLTVIDRYHGPDCRLHAATVEVIAEEGAHVRYASVQDLPEECFELTDYRARADKDARIDWFVGSLGASLTHADVDTYLEGPGSASKSYGVFYGRNSQQFDVSASTFHTGDHSESDMYTRGVLDDKSKAVYRGNIDIAAEAYGCNGYQKEETILLSQDAVADAIPNLEIRNNDVKCSHGATIGRIDEEQLFYLASRGIQEREAVRMVVEGFFEPLTARLDWPELFTTIKPLVEAKLR